MFVLGLRPLEDLGDSKILASTGEAESSLSLSPHSLSRKTMAAEKQGRSPTGMENSGWDA